MLTRGRSLFLLVVIGLILGGGACRSRGRKGDAPGGSGIGFEFPDAAHVTRGALVTQPAGREEAFLTFVARGVPGWVDACRAETGAASPQFVLETDAQGAPRGLPVESSQTPRERCLAARAIATETAGLPSRTRLTVQLALK